MAKKVLPTPKKTPEPRAYVSRASFERALRNAIRRASLHNEPLRFDEAIPEMFRSRTEPTSEAPSVRLENTSALSPFILELRPRVLPPEVLLGDESVQTVRLNFLPVETERITESLEDTSRDLALTPNELAGQLATQAPQSIPKPAFGRMLFHPRIMMRAQTPPECMPLRICTKANHSLDVFEPKPLPENILSYFDLPEEDAEKTARAEDAEQLIDLANLFDVEDVPAFEAEEKPKRSWNISFDFLLLPNGWQQTIAAFVLLSFVFVLPLHAMQVMNHLRDVKTHTESNGMQALQNLKDAAGANLVQNPDDAGAHFSKANIQFGKANEQVASLGAGVNLLLAALAPTQASIKTNTALLKIGSELSIAGSRIADGFSAMQSEVNPTPSSRLALLHLYLGAALPHLEEAERAMKQVEVSAISDEQKQTYEQLANTLPALVASTQDFVALADTLSAILGTNETKHYLLVFQNNTELRPTGGFMGSYAEMRVHNGVMEELTIPGGGTYDLQGQQKVSYVAPWPLQLLSAKWEFQDANWFPDFRTSARQMIAFYKNARGADVDGVIAINASYVEELIALLGPVDMPEYERVIDHENFIAETQKIVEHEYDKTENKPKAFIGALAPKLIEKALNESGDTFLRLAEHINHGLTNKDIQLYFTDNDVEKTVLARGWGGDLKQTDKDYFLLINTNLGGGKTDDVIKEHVDLQVSIAADGTITNTATITRTHTGDPADVFKGANNVNYQRLYVPKGSTLLNAEGFTIPPGSLFDVADPNWMVDPDLQFADASFTIDPKSKTQMYEEEGKTVFGNWTQTKPGNTTVTTYTYTLPFSFAEIIPKHTSSEKLTAWLGLRGTETYSLFLQKQSGAHMRTTTVRVDVPNTVRTLWSSEDLTRMEFGNTHDVFFSALFEPSL